MTKVLLFILIFGLTSQSLLAQDEQVEKTTEPAPEQTPEPIHHDPVSIRAREKTPEEKLAEKNSDDLFDSTHHMVSSHLTGLANQLDSLFGDKRTDDEANKSVLRISTSATYSEFYRSKHDYQVRFNIKLPRLEKFFKISYFNKKADKKEKQEEKERQEAIDRSDTTLNATATNTVTPIVPLETEKGWIFRTDLGVNLGPPPKIFARGRLRRNFLTGPFIHRLSEETGWYSEQGFASVTILNSDYDLADRFLFRFSNEKDWNITHKKFNLAHGPSIIHSIDERTALSYNFRVLIPVMDSLPFVSNYVFSIGYRRNLFSNWLFGEITPALSFVKERSFQRVPSILFKLETYFGAI